MLETEKHDVLADEMELLREALTTVNDRIAKLEGREADFVVWQQGAETTLRNLIAAHLKVESILEQLLRPRPAAASEARQKLN